MPRGQSHQTRSRHPAEPLGGRPECGSRYAGKGRKPLHPIVTLARSEHDIQAKGERASRGEEVHHDDDVLDDPSAGLLAQRSDRTSNAHGNGKDVMTGEVADQRASAQPSARPAHLPSCWDSLSLGSRLKMLRRNLGHSYRKLAALVGVSSTSIGRWESNRSRPTIANLIRLAFLFNVHPGLLLDGVGTDGKIPE